MPKTSAEVILKLVDQTAEDDATYSSTDIQPFVDLADLKIDFTEPIEYATLELDNWALDGTKIMMPDDMTTLAYGYWSLSQALNDLSINVPFEITFGSVHSTIGIVIEFYQNTPYPTDIDVTWYDAGDQVIVSKNFTNNGSTFFADQSVENYKRIVINFNAMSSPITYVKIKEFGFGASISFSGNDLKECQVVEELSSTSEELSINTLSLRVFIKDTDYIQSIYQVLQDQQKLIAYEYVDGAKKDMGTFYLKTRSNPSDNEIVFAAEDLIGVMDQETYLGGIINDTVQNIIDAIMSDFGTNLYSVAPEIANLTVSGYLPVSTYRQAIQRVAFAVNAVVDCSRTDIINIYRLPTANPEVINKTDYFVGHNQKELEKFTASVLSISSYEVSTDTVEVYNVTHTSGSYRAIFSEPVTNLVITGATLDNSGENFAEFTTAGGVVTITGNPYNVSNQIFRKEQTNIPLNVKKKDANFQNTVLWDGQLNVDYLFTRVIDMVEKTASIILTDQQAGSFVQIESLYDKMIEGYIESMEVDMTGGFIGETKVVGVEL